MANILAQVYEAIGDDDCNQGTQSARLQHIYLQADKNTRATLDAAFVALCGWSLETMMSNIHTDTYNTYQERCEKLNKPAAPFIEWLIHATA